jgi:hypothetical protein
MSQVAQLRRELVARNERLMQYAGIALRLEEAERLLRGVVDDPHGVSLLEIDRFLRHRNVTG